MFRTRLSDREMHASIMPFDNLFKTKEEFEELCKRTKNVMDEVIVTIEPLHIPIGDISAREYEKNNIDIIKEENVSN